MSNYNYTTIVIRMPDDSAGRAKIQQALEFLKPYQSLQGTRHEC